MAEPSADPAPPLFPEGLPVTIQALPEGLASLSAQGCNACHFSVHDAWATSAHRGSWVEEPFRSAVEAAGDAPLCLSCHLPLANQQSALLVEYLGGPLTGAVTEANPSWDPTLQQEGVTCAACHVRDGTVVGSRPAPGAPHPVSVSDELTSPDLCATCHQLTWPEADQPFYDTWGEWSRSAYAEAGVRCQDCHMPPVAGAATAGRFSAHPDHGFTSDPARAVSVLVQLPSPRAIRGEAFSAQVRVQNTGAGHSLPTGTPYRQVLLRVEVVDADGEAAAEPFEHRFRREVEGAPPFKTISDNRLVAGEEISLDADFPEVAFKAEGGQGALVVTLRRVGVDGVEGEPFLTQRIPLRVE